MRMDESPCRPPAPARPGASPVCSAGEYDAADLSRRGVGRSPSPVAGGRTPLARSGGMSRTGGLARGGGDDTAVPYVRHHQETLPAPSARGPFHPIDV